MAVKRYTSTADTTITNAFKANMSDRGSAANMGASDSMEVFSIWAQTSSSAGGNSLEKSRSLVKFPIDTIVTDRNNGDIPVSGSVSFYLKIFNVVHPNTMPSNYSLSVLPVSESWDEGYGMDMELYKDTGETSWDDAKTGTAWGSAGGTYHTESAALLAADAAMHAKNVRTLYDAPFSDGDENLEIDISELVEQWVAGTKDNYGVGLMMSGTYEDGSLSASFYTKKFSSRTSEYFYKRPVVEARWDSSKKDNRANFYASSTRVPSGDNLNTLYMYNWVRGQLKNIPGLHASETLVVKLYRDSLADNVPHEVTGGLTDTTGIYTASFDVQTTASTAYDIWSTGSTEYHTGSEITVKSFTALDENPSPSFVTSMVNLKPSYSRKEKARFKLFIRKQNWSPTIYTKATETLDSEIVESAFYKLFRVSDDLEVIPYGTGSTNHTKLSYDQSGSYFDLDMNLLEADFAYGMSFAYYCNGKYVEQSEVFKFRVEK
jgi:hypothetical protein